MIGQGLSVFNQSGKTAVRMFFDEYQDADGDDEPEDDDSGSAADFGEEFTDGGDDFEQQSPAKGYSEGKMDEPDGDFDDEDDSE